MAENDDLLTVIVSRRIRSGREGEYERTMREFASWSRTRPGHAGLFIVRPAAAEHEYTVVARFRDCEARRAYTSSPEYAAWMRRLDELTEGPTIIRELTGLEGLVTLPGQPLRRPAAWKQAVATFLGVLPTALLLGRFLAPHLAQLHWLLAAAIFNGAVVAILTWIVMPVVTRALHRWLFAARAQEIES